MEVRNPVLAVSVTEEVRLLASLLLGRGASFVDPREAGHFQVAADHVARFAVLGPLPRPERAVRALTGQPRAEFLDEIGVQRHFIAAAVLRVRGFDRDHGQLRTQSE
ncbi:MAG TPA: hypothetical protein VM529_24450 [Gemmata sp.]|nr:hypothetical protein [Gemmata sp.]